MITQENIPYTADEIKAMVKTIEELRKKYNEALERAKVYHTGGSISDAHITEVIFPELLESEDEKIKKAIISHLQHEYVVKRYIGDVEYDKWIAWLEKQKDYIKLPNSAYTSNSDVIEFADKYSHTVWEKLMDNFKKIENYSIGCNDVSDLVLNAIINTYNWLEKQGNVDKASYEIAEKEKYDFVSGQFIECRKSFNEFKEDNSYWFEYIGNDTYIGRSDNILNQKFHITPMQLYCLFTQQHCPKENDVNEETNAPTRYGKYVDECLNEAAKHFFSDGEDTYSVADLFYAGVRCGKSLIEKQKNTSAWLEKQDKQPTDKIEPKFKAGDWITDGQLTCKVLGITDKSYELHLYNDDYCHFETDKQRVNKYYHLWSINDAKDGDVLVDSYSKDSIIILYKGIYKERSILAYCGWNGYNLSIKTNGLGYGGLDNTNYLPATKEQRDLLFQKMEEAGYEWDAEKKELKKIEQKTLNADKVIEWLENNLPNTYGFSVANKFKQDFGL